MRSGLPVGALPRACLPNHWRFAGEAGLLGACSGYSDTLLVRRAAQGTAERREVAQSGEREGHEETLVRRHREPGAQSVEIVHLVLELYAAALRVVVAGDRLLQE